jgi:predicted transcriptional regulator
MVRTQIQLTDDQYRRLKQSAAELDKPIAEQIREAVDIYLERQEQPSRLGIRQIAGKFSSKNIPKREPQSLDDWYVESIAERKTGRS